MMINQKKKRHFGITNNYLLVLLFAAGFILSAHAETFQQKTLVENNQSAVFTITTEGDTIFKFVDEPPQFPEGTKKLFNYLNQNINYPQEAWDKGEEGRVIVGFVVDKTGKIQDCQVLRGASSALDEEAIRVVSAMPLWMPGKRLGNVVNVEYTLPVTFKIEKNSLPAEEYVTVDTAIADTVVYNHDEVDEVPEFQGGEKALFRYLNHNIRYPVDAAEKGKQGKVIIRFTIASDGKVKDVKVEKSVFPSLDREALRIVSSMPDWKPGQHKGKAVNVNCTIPVNFRSLSF